MSSPGGGTDKTGGGVGKERAGGGTVSKVLHINKNISKIFQHHDFS